MNTQLLYLRDLLCILLQRIAIYWKIVKRCPPVVAPKPREADEDVKTSRPDHIVEANKPRGFLIISSPWSCHREC